MMMNFMVYGFGLFAYWVIGFAIQMGGVGAHTPIWAVRAAERRIRITLRQDFWFVRDARFFLTMAAHMTLASW